MVDKNLLKFYWEFMPTTRSLHVWAENRLHLLVSLFIYFWFSFLCYLLYNNKRWFVLFLWAGNYKYLWIHYIRILSYFHGFAQNFKRRIGLILRKNLIFFPFYSSKALLKTVAKNTSISIRHLSLDAFARVWKYVQNAEIFLFVPRSI